jgi:16S rRNA (guanine966-N2)-methyltransferase
LRVIAGELKGRKLQKLEGINIRPTSDRVKESLFNILGTRVFDSEFLDLFAGSGGIGIEAYSRGAAKIVFIDESIKSIQVLKGNLEQLKVSQRIEVYNTDYIHALHKLSQEGRGFDIIFVDPPYLKGFAQNALVHISQEGILKEEGLLVIEHDLEDSMPETAGKLRLGRQKKYGNTMLSFYQWIPVLDDSKEE